jgi:hypothetical protein
LKQQQQGVIFSTDSRFFYNSKSKLHPETQIGDAARLALPIELDGMKGQMK